MLSPKLLSWLASSGDTAKGPSPETDAGDLDELREEKEELEAKLEALRAAEYREKLRASCAAYSSAVEASAVSDSSPSQPSPQHEDERCDDGATTWDGREDERGGHGGADNVRLYEDGDIEEMYDFERFHQQQQKRQQEQAAKVQCGSLEGSGLGSTVAVEDKQHKAVLLRLRAREEALWERTLQALII
eukprot:gnl/TRDRNA2_/TRDRNA2_126733_c1_seq1.p1 gnl/TRDRNA2_/TRDRNA2_126733_c1~~gnl/TRDRNA2_/TRDRNA2_126733_c1_seq1.p1  ORF type:complete len:189 (-),score=55.89 gnl/TRDRNA2_/TRDRNA2_126733_c1_seq1:111-677(-)